MLEKIKNKSSLISFIVDTFLYVVSYIFISIVAFFILKSLIEIILKDTIVLYYLGGIAILFSIGLAIATIEKYNKKYNKNDSNSSQRQNDNFFESDIFREEERYSDRRVME